jgi:hypothetical protein
MKKTLLPFCVIALLFSCTKSPSGSNPNNNSTSTYFVSSIRSYSSGEATIDSFAYDTSHALVTFAQYEYDSTQGTPIKDSIITTFLFQGNSGLPTSYTTLQDGSLQQDFLSYDGQGRIVKDTSATESFVTYYSYPANKVISTMLFDGTINGDVQIDTLLLSNGNITSNHINEDGQLAIETFGFAGYANPLYYPGIANSVGPLLFNLTLDGYGGIGDYISKNTISSISGTGGDLPPIPIPISFSIDSKGRVWKETVFGDEQLTYTYL